MDSSDWACHVWNWFLIRLFFSSAHSRGQKENHQRFGQKKDFFHITSAFSTPSKSCAYCDYTWQSSGKPCFIQQFKGQNCHQSTWARQNRNPTNIWSFFWVSQHTWPIDLQDSRQKWDCISYWRLFFATFLAKWRVLSGCLGFLTWNSIVCWLVCSLQLYELAIVKLRGNRQCAAWTGYSIAWNAIDIIWEDFLSLL